MLSIWRSSRSYYLSSMRWCVCVCECAGRVHEQDLGPKFTSPPSYATLDISQVLRRVTLFSLLSLYLGSAASHPIMSTLTTSRLVYSQIYPSPHVRRNLRTILPGRKQTSTERTLLHAAKALEQVEYISAHLYIITTTTY